jgi:hypothetical protein
LAVEVERVARKKHLTMSRAPVALAQRGVETEAEARANPGAAYRRFMAEADPGRKNEAGKDLIRAIFGMDAIAEICFSSRIGLFEIRQCQGLLRLKTSTRPHQLLIL